MTSKGKAGSDAKDAKADSDAAEITEASDGATELTSDSSAQLPHHSFIARLYTGTGAFEVVGRRRLWYGISGAIVAVAILSIILRGFTFGIDFKGGTTVSMPVATATGTVATSQVQEVFKKTLGRDAASVVTVGNGASATVQISSETLSNDQTSKLRNALFDAFRPRVPTASPARRPSVTRRYRRPGAIRSPRRRCSRWPCSWCWSASTSSCATSATWPSPR